MSDAKKKCGMCTYCVESGYFQTGYCLRHAPIGHGKEHGEYLATWPKINTEYHWCGDYEPKPPLEEPME